MRTTWRALHPDVILMPRCDGLQATRLITTSADDESLFEAIKSGGRSESTQAT